MAMVYPFVSRVTAFGTQDVACGFVPDVTPAAVELKPPPPPPLEPPKPPQPAAEPTSARTSSPFFSKERMAPLPARSLLTRPHPSPRSKHLRLLGAPRAKAGAFRRPLRWGSLMRAAC